MIDGIVFGGLGVVFLALVLGLVYSLFCPDRKRPIGAYKSYARKIERPGEEHWGTLTLSEGELTFVRHDGNGAASLPLSAVTSAQFVWGSRLVLSSIAGRWEFSFAPRGLPANRDVRGPDGARARREWSRQLSALGISIETEVPQ